MKKKLLSLLLASVTALSVAGGLAACDNGGGSTWTEEEFSGEIIVWAPQESLSGYQGLVDTFKTEHPAYKNMTITWEPVGENETNDKIKTNPSDGGHIFFYPSDKLQEMAYQTKILQPLPTHYSDIVKGRDVAATYEFATLSDGSMYGFPATNDNCYFLWYDKTAVTEEQVKTLDGLIEAAKSGSTTKHILWNYAEAWYSMMFYLGDANIQFEFTDDELTQYATTVDSDVGKKVTKAMYNYIAPENNGTGDNAVITWAGIADGLAKKTAVAGIGGSWEKQSIMDAMAEAGRDFDTEIGTAVLPKFKCEDNTEYNLGSFAGAKYCGVNSFKPEAEVKAALAFAEFLTSEKGQLARYAAQGSGPSNINAINSAAVKADTILSTILVQTSDGHCTVQGAQSGKFWTCNNDFVKPIYDGQVDASHPVNADNLLDLLDTFAAGLRTGK